MPRNEISEKKMLPNIYFKRDILVVLDNLRIILCNMNTVSIIRVIDIMVIVIFGDTLKSITLTVFTNFYTVLK